MMRINICTLGVLSALGVVSASALAQQAHLGGYTPQINNYDRDQVVALYKNYAAAATTLDRNAVMNWTGALDGCNPGTTSFDYQNMMLRGLNFARSLVGNANATMQQQQFTDDAQAAALVQFANYGSNGLSHSPGTSWKCYSTAAARGSQGSQLFVTSDRQRSDLYSFLDDWGASNFDVGHRQILLDSELRFASVGAVGDENFRMYSNVVPGNWSSLAVRGHFSPAPKTEPSIVRWPSAGFFPVEYYPSSSRWSVGCVDCDATRATATATLNGVTIPVTVNPPSNVGGDVFWNTVVFEIPSLLATLALRASAVNRGIYGLFLESTMGSDVVVNVSVKGLRKKTTGEVLPDDNYSVTLINTANTPGKILAPTRLDGLWQGAGETGGLHLANTVTGTLTGTWLTYAADGSPVWYTLSDGRFTDVRTFMGKLMVTQADGSLQLVGGATLALNGDSTTAGGATAATMTFSLNGQTGTKALSRMMQGPVNTDWGAHNFTGTWQGNATGSGRLLVAQDYRSVYSAWATMESGVPVWYQSLPGNTSFGQSNQTNVDAYEGVTQATTGVNIVRNTFTGTLQATRGTEPTQAWNAQAASATTVGTVRFRPAPVVWAASDVLNTPAAEENLANITVNFNGSVPSASNVQSAVSRQGNALFNQGSALVRTSQRGGIDVDGNGRHALVLRNTNAGQMLVGRFANDQFQFTPMADPGTNFRVLGAVDLMATGKSDLLIQDMSSTTEFGVVSAWRGFNAGNVQVLRSVKKDWVVQATGDLDGDSKGDLVWRWTRGDADFGVSYIWFTDASNATTPVQQVRKRGGAPLSWQLLGAMDVNQDGAADLVYLSPSNEIRVLMATSAVPRTCANYRAGFLPDGFSVVKYADFTGARRGGDILIKNDITGELRVLSIVANGTVLPVYTGTPDDANAACTSTASQFTLPTVSVQVGQIDPSWSYFAAGDFDGNGQFDVAWLRPDRTLAVTLLRMNDAPRLITNAGVVPTGFTPIPLQ
ncbi:MAG: hypothetical protein ING75_15155 [Rhodocyclaceae bacterium]|nr:hypothetical protein [Rhodocyclaceae bacterium]